ncbi:MAG: histidine phosphatase family protein [Betaproteobacteria bacterium]|nr:histidine phosphatase family protein [Betaproteobacteria bacterium]
MNDSRDSSPLIRSGTAILLIRHGETLWNRWGRVQGWQDSPLTEVGLAQAHALAARLAGDRVERLVSSDLGRARQTAEPIVHRTGLAIELDPELRERNYGIFEGRTYGEIEREDPEAYAFLTRRDPTYVIPGGESGEAFSARVLRALERIAGTHAGHRIAVMTHGGVLGVLYRHATRAAPDSQRDYSLANASVNHVWFGGGSWVIERWGDVAHLPRGAADDPVD